VKGKHSQRRDPANIKVYIAADAVGEKQLHFRKKENYGKCRGSFASAEKKGDHPKEDRST